MRVLLFAFLSVLLPGCGHVTASQVVRGTVAAVADLAECAPNEYTAVKDAISSGNSVGGWISAVFQAIQCVPKVVRDIEAQTQTADAGGRIIPRVLPRDLVQRIAVSKAMYRVCEPWIPPVK